jgi:16S rRNA (cytidine1402-2'-O)-methyltransferase
MWTNSLLGGSIACEDTRTTGKLLARHGIRNPSVRLVSFNEFATADKIQALVQRATFFPVALMADAGTPTISDPGVRLVAAAHERGVLQILVSRWK